MPGGERWRSAAASHRLVHRGRKGMADQRCRDGRGPETDGSALRASRRLDTHEPEPST